MPHALTRLRTPVFNAVLALLATGLVLTSLTVTAPAAEAATREERVRHAAKVARNQIGDPYQYGAAGPDRFDCSGLIYYSARQAGIRDIPRTSRDQANYARRIPKDQMRRGDLLFFYDGGGVYHVGMFLRWQNGRRVMVSAPSSGKTVRRDVPWTSSWFAGTLR